MPISNKSKIKAQDTLIFPASDYNQIRGELENSGNDYEPTRLPEGLLDPVTQANFDIRSYQEIFQNKLASAKKAIIGQENRIKILRVRDEATGSLKEVILYYKDLKLHQHTQILENPQDGMVEKVAKDLQFYIKLAESEHAGEALKSAYEAFKSLISDPQANVLDQFQELKKLTIEQLASGDQNLQAQAQQINQQLSSQSDQPKNTFHQTANCIVAQKFMRSVAVRSHNFQQNEQDQDNQRLKSFNLADEGTKRSEVTGTGISAGYKPATPREVDIQRYNYRSANEAEFEKPSTTEVVYIKIKKLNGDGSLLIASPKRFDLYPGQGDEGKKICYLKVSFKDGTPTIDTKYIYASSASSKNQKIPITLASVEELANEDSKLLLSSLKQMQINIVNNEIDQGLTMSKSTTSLQVGELINRQKIEEGFRLNRSATAIQAAYKSMRARKKVTEVREERKAREDRERKIQALQAKSEQSQKQLQLNRTFTAWHSLANSRAKTRNRVDELSKRQQTSGLRTAFDAFKSYSKQSQKRKELEGNQQANMLRQTLQDWRDNVEESNLLKKGFKAWRDSSIASKTKRQQEEQSQREKAERQAIRDQQIEQFAIQQRAKEAEARRRQQSLQAESERYSQLPKFLQTIYNQASGETKTAIFAFDEVARNFQSSRRGDISQILADVERSLQTLFRLVPEKADSIKSKLKSYLKNPSQDNPYKQLSRFKDQLFPTEITDQTAYQQGFPRSQSPQPQVSADIVFSNDVKDLRDDGTRVPDSWEDDADEEGIAPQDRSPLSPQPLSEERDIDSEYESDDDSDAESIQGGDLKDFITSQVFIHGYQVNQQDKSAEIEEVVRLVGSIKGFQNEEDGNIEELFEKVCNLFDNSKDENQKVQSINAIVGEIAKELNDQRGIKKLLELNGAYQNSHGNQRGEFLRSPSPGFSDDEGNGPDLGRMPSRSPSPSPSQRSDSRDRQPLSRPRNLSTDSNCIVS